MDKGNYRKPMTYKHGEHMRYLLPVPSPVPRPLYTLLKNSYSNLTPTPVPFFPR